MGWYSDEYRRRFLFFFATTESDTGKVNVALWPQVEHPLWEFLAESEDAVRVTLADGVTRAPYKWDDSADPGPDPLSRQGPLNVGLQAVVPEALNVLFVYTDTDAPSDGSGSPGTSNQRPGYAYVGVPLEVSTARPLAPGASEPEIRVQRTTGDAGPLWIRVDGLLETRADPYQGRDVLEEVAAVQAFDLVNGQNASPSLIDLSKSEIAELWGPHGRELYVGIWLDGGTDATDYTVVVRLQVVGRGFVRGSGQGARPARTVEIRALVMVRDVEV